VTRLPAAGMSRGAMAGSSALPQPRGDADQIRAAAGALTRAAHTAGATTTVRGALAPLLAQVWSGPAADAATAEAAELARRSRTVLASVTEAARALATYATALDVARSRVHALQQDWDALEVDHARAVVLVALTAAQPTQPALGLDHLLSHRDAVRARLSRAHEAALDELRQAGLRAARQLAAVTEALAPGVAARHPDDIRTAVTGGLALADGLARARASRSLALREAAYLRGLMGPMSAGATGGPEPGRSPEAATRAAVSRLREHRGDPVYAQALLDELGTDGVGQLVTELGSRDGGVGVDTMRALLGVLGSIVVTATRGSRDLDVDEGTRALTAGGAALVADSLVRAAGSTYDDRSGHGRNAGYWVLGQLLVGARGSGDRRSLPPAVVARLAAAASSAEVAETRDSDSLLRHGTTATPNGGEFFASWFERGDETGDALHVLLAEVGDDPEEAAALLTTPLANPALAGPVGTNSRGDRTTVAEHLTRRWITYEANAVESHTNLRLATNDDLVRLVRQAGEGAAPSLGAAEARARIDGELGRASSWAHRETSTASLYEQNTRPVEDESMRWSAGHREAISSVIRGEGPAEVSEYARLVDGRAVPVLTRDELVALVGGYATAGDVGAHTRDPAASYDRLVEAELARLADPAQRIADQEESIRRLGFLDAAASATLMAQAGLHDARSKVMWQSIAEAKNVVLVGRTFVTTAAGPGLAAATKGLVEPGQSLLESGTTRDAIDDLAIEVVRSDLTLDQALLNERRSADLQARVAESLRAAGSGSSGREAFLAGAAAAPLVRTSEEVRRARAAELAGKVHAVLDERAEQRLVDGTDRRERDVVPVGTRG